MSLKYTLLDGVAIEKKGLFDFKETYSHAKKWLEAYNYTVIEKSFKHKEGDGGRDVEVEWTVTREIDEYTQFNFEVKWKGSGLTDVKVKINKKDVKLQKGKVKLEVNTFLMLDWQDKWEESPVLKFMRALFEKYLYKKQLDELKSQLWKEGWNFYNEMKTFLNMYDF